MALSLLVLRISAPSVNEADLAGGADPCPDGTARPRPAVANPRHRITMPGDGNGVTSLAVSGQRVAAAYRDGTVRILDGSPLASP